MSDKKINKFYYIPVFLLFLIFFLYSMIEATSYDLWLHLKTGEWIFNNLKIPREQLFSYSIGPVPWVDHSWLFQVIIFFIHRYIGGINALISFRALLLIIPVFLAVKTALRKVSVPWLLLVSLLCFNLVNRRFLIRPELFSMLFLGLYLYTLMEYPNSKRVYFLIPVQVLWVNIHGYSIIGPILLGVFLIAEFIKDKLPLPFEWNKAKRIENRQSWKRYMLVLILSIAAFICNPYLLRGMSYPVFALRNLLAQPRIAYHAVTELSPLSLYNIVFTQHSVVITAVIFIFFLSTIINIKRFDIFNLFLFLSFMILALAANRNIGFFGIVSAFAILNICNTKRPIHPEAFIVKKPLIHILRFLGRCTVLAIIAFYAFTLHSFYSGYYVHGLANNTKKKVFGISQNSYPINAANFIIENNIKGPIFNNFNTGAYLIWRLYPKYKVFIDGRTEVYGDDFLKRYYAVMFDFNKWLALDKEHSFNAVLLSNYRSDSCFYLICRLYKDKNWRLVYFDRGSFVFLKDNEDNKELISKYQISLEDFKDPASKESLLKANRLKAYPGNYILGARFFIKAMNLPLLALNEIKKAEIINPYFYGVYQLKGYIYFKQRDYPNAYKAFRRSIRLVPNSTEAYLNLGSICGKMGLFDEALRNYKEALSIDPRNKSAKRFIEIIKDLKSKEKSPSPKA